MAILFAAIAVEVRIKTFLSQRATREQAPLLQLILKNPRGVASLYDTTLRAITNRSLRQDHLDSYRSLEKLFYDRNSLAHIGEIRDIDSDTISADISAAETAFRYLWSIRE